MRYVFSPKLAVTNFSFDLVSIPAPNTAFSRKK